jgi:multiple sugar transport system ATP-binding protein
VEPTGSETHLVVQLGSQEITCVLHKRMMLAPGETVSLSLRSSNVHFFDRTTQQRLATAVK